MSAASNGPSWGTGAGIDRVTSEILGPESAGAIAGLCRLSLGPDTPEPADLADCLFRACGGSDAAIMRGDPEVGVVGAVRRRDEGHIRLLAVHPRHQRRGIGTALLQAAERDLADCSHVTVGADAPDYLFPGVATHLTSMLCLMEARGYRRIGAHLNMAVDLGDLPDDPGGTALAGGAEREEVGGWMAEHWPAWSDEALKALDKQRLLLARDRLGISGFCAWDVNRGGWLGPIAVRRDAIGGRIGVPLLLGALHRMREDDGRARAEIAWVSPLRFYVRNVGAAVSTTFLVHRRRVGAGPDINTPPGARGSLGHE